MRQTNVKPGQGRRRAGVIDRRTFLRGAGVTMALPWLESLAGFGTVGSTAGAATGAATGAAAAVAPKRLAVMFMANGISPDHWWAKGDGAEMEFGKTLAPLEPLKAKVNVVQGLFNKSSTGLGIHPPMTGNLLTGVPIAKGAIIHSGISFDQLLANRIGQETPQASLVLSCEQPMTGYHETNYSRIEASRTRPTVVNSCRDLHSSAVELRVIIAPRRTCTLRTLYQQRG
jgi:hypothetical protein